MHKPKILCEYLVQSGHWLDLLLHRKRSLHLVQWHKFSGVASLALLPIMLVWLAFPRSPRTGIREFQQLRGDRTCWLDWVIISGWGLMTHDSSLINIAIYVICVEIVLTQCVGSLLLKHRCRQTILVGGSVIVM